MSLEALFSRIVVDWNLGVFFFLGSSTSFRYFSVPVFVFGLPVLFFFFENLVPAFGLSKKLLEGR